MERSIVIPATTQPPKTEKEALKRRASLGVISDFVGTLKAKGIYAQTDREGNITYLNSYRPEVEELAKKFELQLFVCYEP
mgnify:FL=1